jgi:hypothetical protein
MKKEQIYDVISELEDLNHSKWVSSKWVSGYKPYKLFGL